MQHGIPAAAAAAVTGIGAAKAAVPQLQLPSGQVIMYSSAVMPGSCANHVSAAILSCSGYSTCDTLPWLRLACVAGVGRHLPGLKMVCDSAPCHARLLDWIPLTHLRTMMVGQPVHRCQ
jgi:hypothetical protein